MPTGKGVYALVYNIPLEMRSKHLRKFFKVAVEKNHFRCFHFRHRSSEELTSQKLPLESKTNVCFVKVLDGETLKKLQTNYHDVAWERDKPHLCKMEPLLTMEDDQEGGSIDSIIDVDREISIKTLKSYVELRPPRYLKRGNVGTTVTSVMKEIRLCKFPPSLLARIGINIQEECYRNKYACFSWDYDGEIGFRSSAYSERDAGDESERTVDPYELDDASEEWERHEALHEDPFKLVPRERLFESEKEVVWEKGSSGLVWYTDAQYWDSLEGNDEKETDDWDMIPDESDDEPEQLKATAAAAAGGGAAPRNDEPLRAKKKRKRAKSGKGAKLENGIGGRLLKRYGWKVGQGLGPRKGGIAEPIPSDGQMPSDKRGFGYRGLKLFDFKTPGSF